MKFLSQVYTAVSGSVGGLTYSRNRFGMYTRARATPVNPNTIRQQEVRASMSSMVVYWHATLTAAQRAAWGVYGANTPIVDALGQSQNLSGQQMFLRSNIARVNLGLAVIVAAPTIFDLGQPVVGVTSVVVAAGVITTTFTVGGAGSSTTCTKIMQIGVAQNVGRNFFRGPYQIAFATSGASATTAFVVPRTLATSTQWLAAFQPVVGNYLPIRLRILYDDGRLSAPFAQFITVA